MINRIKNNRMTCFYRGLLLNLLLLVTGSICQMSAQCPNLVLVGATDFSSHSGFDAATHKYHDFDKTSFYGPTGARMSAPPNMRYAATPAQVGTYTGGGQAWTGYYGIVDNPRDVNPAWADIADPMLIVPWPNNNFQLLDFFVPDLVPGANIYMKITGYYLTYTCASNQQLGISINELYSAGRPDLTSTLQPPPSATDRSFSITTPTRQLGGGLTYADISIKTPGGNITRGCVVLGITRIEVYSCPNVEVVSSESAEVCEGEITRLNLDRDYNAPSYEWEKSTTSASGPWNPFGADNKSVLDEISGTTWYRCRTLGIQSKILQINAITCCQNSDGTSASRKVIYYDNFGTFDGPTTYRDAWGKPRTTLDPYCTDLEGGVYQHIVRCGGQLQEGHYRVSTFEALMGYMKGCIDTDATNNPKGGILSMDVKTSHTGLIYERLITGLCSGKEIYFQIAYSPGNTMSQAARVRVVVARNAGTQASRPEISSFQQNGGFLCSWQTIKLPPFVLPEGETSAYLRFESHGTAWNNGEDLNFDDIKFMVCMPPNVELYSNLKTLKQDTIICGPATFKMGTFISELVKSTFGGEENVYYLFQYSFNKTKWNNIGGIVHDPYVDVDMDDYPGETVYFRVAVATEGALKPYLDNPDYEDYDDNCRNTSVSRPVSVTRGGNLNMGGNETLTGCKGEQLTLKGPTEADEPKILQWGWVDASGKSLVAKGTNPANRNYTLTISKTDTIYFVGYTANCTAQKRFIINEKPKPTVTLHEVSSVCGRTSIRATSSPLLDIVHTYSWTFTNGAEIATNGPGVILESPAYTSGTISVVETTQGFCQSEPATLYVTIKATPAIPTATTPLSYPMAPGSVNISSDANVQYTAGNELYWCDASGNRITTPTQSTSSEGTFFFYAGQVSTDGCRSDSVRITVIITTEPAPVTHDTTICQGKTLDLTKLAQSTDNDIYSLVWYTNPDAPKGTGSDTPPTVSNSPGEHFYYVAQKNKGNNDESGKMPIAVTVTVAPSATISYSQTAFCTSDNAKQVILTGTEGGTFSANSVDIALNVLTGVITPNSSSAGTYIITYTIPPTNGCDEFTTTTTVTITQEPSVTIAYPGTPFCTSATTQAVVFADNGAGEYTGGTFHSIPAVNCVCTLALNPDNGEITPSNSTPVTYTVVYTIPEYNGCSAKQVNTTVTITKEPSATIAYEKSSFCTSDGAKTVILTGTGGGTFSAPADIAINALSGIITPNESEAGVYTVTYTIPEAGGCAEFTTTTTVTITEAPSATISYAKESFCISEEDIQQVNLSGYGGGNYTVAPAGLFIDTGSGSITPNKSDAGTYTVTYTVQVPGGECEPVTANALVKIIPSPEVKILTTAGKSICPDETFEISGSFANGTILWSSSGGGVFSDYSTAVTTYKPSASDADKNITLTLTVTGNDACSAEKRTDNYNLNVTPFPEKPVVNGDVIYLREHLTDNKFKNVLEQKPDAVTPSADATLYWSKDNGATWSTTPPTPDTPAANDYTDKTYNYLVKQKLNSPPGCESQTTTVTARIFLTATPAVNNVSYCIDDVPTPLIAAINPASNYNKSDYILIWYDNAGNIIRKSAAGVENDGPVPSADETGKVTYHVSQYNTESQAESGRVPLEVTVYGVKKPDVSGNRLNYCAGDTPDELTVNKVEEAPYCLANGFEWSVNGNKQNSKPSVNTNVSTNTTYRYGVKQTYKISESKTCYGEENFFNVHVTEKFTLSLTATPDKVQVGNETTLTVTASTDNHGDYKWYDKDVLYKTTDRSENVIKEMLSAGAHLFQVKTSNDECSAESNIQRIEVADFTVIPNIITPYAEKNNTFMVSKNISEGYRVEIYNRYQQKVYEGDNGWDGAYRGTPAEPGTYFYRVFMKDGRVEVGTVEVAKF